ncbi:MAG: CHASE2 domain-containing protein [Pseudomonadota bacterium]
MPDAARGGPPARIFLIGATLLAALALMNALGAPWTERLQSAWFDAHQAMHPRQVNVLPVTVVEIDQKSLLALGQWPWPRTRLAELVDAINAVGPAAIGVDVLMPEVDALSPEHLLAEIAITDPTLTGLLAALPSNDRALANALLRAPAVMAFAGTPEPSRKALRSVPILIAPSHSGDASTPKVKQHAGALTNIDALDEPASGWGLISVDTTHGVLRRMPLVASIDGTLVPSLALEMLRVATKAPNLRLSTDGGAATAVTLGDLRVPTEPDAAVRPYFSPRRTDRFVSAVDVLQGKVDASMLRGQLVLIGPTAIGLHDYQDTPVGERMPGSEIHAQLIENLLAGSLLQRPTWAAGAEALLLLILGAMLLRVTPRIKPGYGALLVLVCMLLPVLAAFALFDTRHLLFDAATPGLSLLLLFVVMAVLTLGESTRQRKALQAVVQAQREQSARIAGELEAAQRIQTGSLPRLDLLQGDQRIELYATLTAAREVGGDLYDFFRLDADRLFLLVGDVAGKGLSASIFMAVSKALYKSAMLRSPNARIGQIMSAANAEVSRDNPEMLFVTVFAAILDLSSGELEYCNAGHDNPYRLHASRHDLARIEDGDGPPLCAMGDFDYQGARCQLLPGEALCLMTDGVTEAQNPAAELYGQARAQEVLRRLNNGTSSARELVTNLRTDVMAFSDGAEAADDLTILALRWHGQGRP